MRHYQAARHANTYAGLGARGGAGKGGSKGQLLGRLGQSSALSPENAQRMLGGAPLFLRINGNDFSVQCLDPDADTELDPVT